MMQLGLAAGLFWSSLTWASPPPENDVAESYVAEGDVAPVVAPAAERSDRERRAKRRFITSGVLLGLAFVGEMTGAGISTACISSERCNDAAAYTWGSNTAGSRVTFIASGPGLAYVGARAIAVPLVDVGAGLLLAGAYERGRADGPARERVVERRGAWAMLGTGIGIYLASRLARLGFALTGACQVPGCVYAFDQATLGSSRALMLTGGALLVHGRTLKRLRWRLGPTAGWGIAIHGEF